LMVFLSWTWITPKWLHTYITEKKGNAIIIDVRTPREHEMGHIPGTDLLIPHTEIAKRISEIKADPEKDTVIVYCRSGRRSTYAARILEAKGFKHVLNLRGGIKAWRARGYELVKPERKRERTRNLERDRNRIRNRQGDNTK